jgi:hypothetical protein
MSRPELTAWLNDIITSVIDQRRSQLTASAALADDDNGITASRSLAGLNRKISEYAKGVNWHNLNHLTAEAFAVNLLSNDSTIDTPASLSEIIDRLGDIEMRDIAISIVRKVAATVSIGDVVSRIIVPGLLSPVGRCNLDEFNRQPDGRAKPPHPKTRRPTTTEDSLGYSELLSVAVGDENELTDIIRSYPILVAPMLIGVLGIRGA